MSAKGSGQTCLGPVQSIQDSKSLYDRAISRLRDPGSTRFVFVLQPDSMALAETRRAVAEIEQLGVRSLELIVNGVLPEAVCADSFFGTRRQTQQRYLTEIETQFPLPLRRMELREDEIKGLASLREVGRALMAQESHEQLA